MGVWFRKDQTVSYESRRGPKAMALLLRLDPKTRFILELTARIKGQSITTVVERAIKETATSLASVPAITNSATARNSRPGRISGIRARGFAPSGSLAIETVRRTSTRTNSGHSQTRTGHSSTSISAAWSHTGPTSMCSGPRSTRTRGCGGKTSAATTGRSARRCGQICPPPSWPLPTGGRSPTRKPIPPMSGSRPEDGPAANLPAPRIELKQVRPEPSRGRFATASRSCPLIRLRTRQCQQQAADTGDVSLDSTAQQSVHGQTLRGRRKSHT